MAKASPEPRKDLDIEGCAVNAKEDAEGHRRNDAVGVADSKDELPAFKEVHFCFTNWCARSQ